MRVRRSAVITALVLVGGLAVVFSSLLLEVRVALSVAGAVLSGAMMEASGRAEPPELVTAWQPPVAPWQSPVPQEPPASGEPPGSVPVAALRTEPVQVAKVDDALDSV